MLVTIELPSFPPKQRPKFKREGSSVMAYYDQDYEPLRQSIIDQWKGAPLTGRVALEMDFRVPMPKRTSKATRARMLAGEIRPSDKHVDSLLRALMDAMVGVVVHDDRQVVFLSGRLSYGEAPGATVRVGEAVFLAAA